MNLQVQPLKILAMREVIMNRMDYSTYLTGTTKKELDRLDMLAGDFKVQASKLTFEAVRDGKNCHQRTGSISRRALSCQISIEQS